MSIKIGTTVHLYRHNEYRMTGTVTDIGDRDMWTGKPYFEVRTKESRYGANFYMEDEEGRYYNVGNRAYHVKSER